MGENQQRDIACQAIEAGFGKQALTGKNSERLIGAFIGILTEQIMGRRGITDSEAALQALTTEARKTHAAGYNYAT